VTTLKSASIVLVAFAVIYALRALPFIILSRSAAEGKWFKLAERWLSTIVIALLVVYSFSTLEWRTYMPYAAALVTVAIQLLWRNGLVSIFAGTALYMILVRL